MQLVKFHSGWIKSAFILFVLTTFLISQVEAGPNKEQGWGKGGKKQQTNSAPTISGVPDSDVFEGSIYAFHPGASDPDGDSLTFSISNRPAWANFNTTTGHLSGFPGSGDVGTYSNIVIKVGDGSLSSSLPAFSVTVSANPPANSPPTISGTPITSVSEDSAYVFEPSSSDADGDILSFNITNRPTWANFNSTTGRLAGTPDNSHVGSYDNITITASDGESVAGLGPFSIQVLNINGAPTISGSPATSIDAESTYSFQPTATDPDGDVLTFSVINSPVWAIFDETTGRLSGTPTNADIGTHNDIVISVTDGTDTVALTAFSIAVGDGLLAMYTFSEGSGSTVRDVSGVGTPLDLQIQDSANVQWLNGGGLSVDQSTLIVSSTVASKIISGIKATSELTVEAWISPANTTQTGPARIVTLSTDTSSRNFTLGQADAAYDFRLRTASTDDNGTPSLSSPIGLVSTNPTYVVYTRTAEGVAALYVDGVKQSEQLVTGDLSNWDSSYRFAIANEMIHNRAWLGNYYQVAVYNRAFSVWDVDNGFAAGIPADTTTAGGDLQDASVITQDGSILLSWNAPVERADGSALTSGEISGYTVHYGTSQGNYTDSVYIPGSSTTSATIENLSLGTTYYAVMTTTDTSGQESAYSVEAVKSAH